MGHNKMGTSKVYTSLDRSHSEDALEDRVVSSILSNPLDLDCRLPDSYHNTGHTQSMSCKRKLLCAISCLSEALCTRKAIKSFNLDAFLSKVHIILSISSKDSTFTACGTVIASRYVLTAASNVFNRESNREVDLRDIKILFQNDRVDIISNIEVIDICYSKKYVHNGEEDFALLLLDRDIGAFSGSFGLKPLQNEELAGKPLYLCGYEKLEEKQDEYQIRKESDLDANISGGFINCSISMRNLL